MLNKIFISAHTKFLKYLLVNKYHKFKKLSKYATKTLQKNNVLFFINNRQAFDRDLTWWIFFAIK